MINVRNTENLTGVTVSGDLYDLEQMTDALHGITISDFEASDKESMSYIRISLRVLGVCYDIRHAYQGDREIYTEDNGISDFHMEHRGIIVPKKNVYYACNILYPEMILVMMTLNELVRLRMRKLAKTKYEYDALFDKRVIRDSTIAAIRMLQMAFSETVPEVLSNVSFKRWQGLIQNKFIAISDITDPFVDSWNLRYLQMTKEERAKKILTITKRFAEYRQDPENMSYCRAINQAIAEHGWTEGNIRFDHLAYPEEVEW